MKAALIAICACACGGDHPAAATAKPVAATPGPPDIDPEVFCDKFAALKEADCAAFSQLEMTRKDCIDELHTALGDANQRDFMRSTGRCVIEYASCGDVVACLAALAPDSEHLRACTDTDPNRAVGLPRAEWDHRNGAGVTKFSQAHSTKQAPIEVCTVRAENEWLESLRCDDTSQPIQDFGAAEMARVGNLGKAGRCNAIVDLYRVKCPEATYDIFLDGYVCPIGGAPK